MITLVVVFVGLVGAVGVVALFTLKKGDTTKVRRILADLGLHQGSWSKDEGSQFFKWGWHQEQENRVSAERMVKQAFQKAGVWLDKQDLGFFQTQCKNHESKKEINQQQIEERIHEIIKRSERVRRWISEQIQGVLNFVLNASLQEAKVILQHARVEADSEAVYETLLTLEMQRMMNQHGAKILTIDAKGLIVQDPTSAQTFLLEKMDSWRHLVRMFKEEILDISLGRRMSIPANICRALRIGVESGFLRIIEEDIQRQHSFLRKIHDQFHNKEINVSYERAKTVDSILYKWKFDNNTNFGQEHHNRIRDVLTRLDLAPRFREVLFERFEDSYSSLIKMLHIFPREVIFYGGNGATRSFATDQYSRHFMALLEAFASPLGRETTPPSIIWVNDEQIEKMRQGPKRGSNAVTLTQLMTDQQRISWLEQGISEEIATNRGWIINLSVDYPTTDEFEALSKEPFKRFVRFHCEAGENVDFLNNTYGAKKSRVQFFNLIVDSLVGVPSLQENSSKTDAENQENTQSSSETPLLTSDSEMDDLDDLDDLDSISQPTSGKKS